MKSHCKKCGREFDYEPINCGRSRKHYCADCKREIDRARRKAWRDSHKAHCAEYGRKWREAHPEYFAIYHGREYIAQNGNPTNREFVCQDCGREFQHKYLGRKPRFCPRCLHEHHKKSERAWIKQDPAAVAARNREKQWKIKLRCYLDADYYATHRRRSRERSLEYRNRKMYATRPRKLRGGVFRPQPARTIPDWCTRGDVLDVRSPWLWENVTDSQRAYAKELFIEWKEKRRIAK